ncbi:hypothetical protein [Nocardioides flavescens]|uniref:Uncharacterized protein n=1 Tax=Nocardioides flavescens TaxID=2691959 RepID=A0A6L7EWZ4_9ACTN|nr:hypothetical protein [Nocardioides flavescens]MXG89948.1 hypothetical protein [Nocardioides flavescens]
MGHNTYEAPAITEVGSLHDMTLQFKTFGAADGVILVIPGVANVPIGESDENGNISF